MYYILSFCVYISLQISYNFKLDHSDGYCAQDYNLTASLFSFPFLNFNFMKSPPPKYSKLPTYSEESPLNSSFHFDANIHSSTNRYPAQPSPTQSINSYQSHIRQPPLYRDWTFGLFDCFSDMSTCLLSCCIPCYIYGQNKQAFQQKETYCGVMINIDYYNFLFI